MTNVKRRADRLRPGWMASLIAIAIAAMIAAGCGSEDGGTETVESGSKGAVEARSELKVDAAGVDKWVVSYDVFDVRYPESGPISVPDGLQFTPLNIVDPADVPEGLKICYFQNGLNNPWLEQTKAGAEQAAEMLGVELVYQDAGWDSTKQLNQVQNAISQGDCDGIVASPMDPGVMCKAFSTDASDAGIPVVTMNGGLCDSITHHPDTVAWVGTQNEEYFEQMYGTPMQWLSERGGGEVGIVQGPAEFPGTQVSNRVLDRLEGRYPGVEIVQRLPGPFTTEAGLSSTQTLLNAHPDIRLLLSQYDANTVGIVKALRSAGKKPGDVMIGTSGGGDHTQFEHVRDGWVLQGGIEPPLEESGHAVELMAAHLAGYRVPTEVVEGGTFSTRENLGRFQVEN